MFLIFTFSLVLVWDGWQRYQNPERYVQQEESSSVRDLSVPQASVSKNARPSQAEASSISVQEAKVIVGKTIRIKTDVVEAGISTQGGDINYLALLKHPDGQDKTKPMILFQQGEGTHNYVAQTGLLGPDMPNHNSMFDAEHDSYELSGGEEQLQIRLKLQGESALKVTKVITFHKSSYLVDVTYELENTSNEAISTSSYFQLIRDSETPEGTSSFLPTYTGAAVYTDQEKFQKVDFSSMEDESVDYPTQAEDGWIGMLQHYFVTAWLPEENTPREYFTRKLDGDRYAVGVVQQEQIVEPGQKSVISSRLYAGPAQNQLDDIAPGLGLTVDYGWLTIVASPLFWLMTKLHGWTGNWGVAIILLTCIIKLFFFPLSAASYRSMAKMRVVAPKLEKIKKQYADDREQLNRAMMDLYKTEKINPLGGCLPILVQIPVFIALYWSILASVEMRYAPFVGWITDLSAADPYYIMPVVMGLSMVVQMRLNPKPTDPIQAKVMQIMPIAFSVMFFFFPAGLVLYSIVNNLLSIAQQWHITRAAEDAEKRSVATRR
ncbi:MAG: membrane protein insertase YidC [Gallionella sp.]